MVNEIEVIVPRIAMESNGYATVAKSIAQDPDNETYIFRRFDRLTARNLLTIQGELLALQHELDVLDNAAASSLDAGLHAAMRSWAAMHANIPDGDGGDVTEKGKRVRIAAQLEVKLKRYHKALLLSSEVLKLESPDRRMIEAHRSVLKDVAEKEQKELKDVDDLVALKPPADKDVLSRTLRTHWPVFNTAPSSLEPDKIRYFGERNLARLTSALSIIIAAVLIVGPILTLNFVTSPNARLSIAIAFIVLFATLLGLSTGVSRDNIFVATATYSAVLVVFVSGNLGDTGIASGTSGSSSY